MVPDVVGGPNLRVNVLKARKRAAAARAERALDALAPGGGHPLDTALRMVEGGAWLSGSPARAAFVADLTGAGRAVSDALASHAARCAGEAALEPAQVDADDPREGWKASSGRIDGRVGRSGHGRGMA